MYSYKSLAIILVVFALAVAGCGDGNTVSGDIAFAKGCKANHPNKVSGRTILKVSGSSCAIADKKAIVVARDHAWVAAHGDSIVDAADHVTIVVFNDEVKCNIRGNNVTVINAISTNGLDGSLGFLDPTCDTLLSG